MLYSVASSTLLLVFSRDRVQYAGSTWLPSSTNSVLCVCVACILARFPSSFGQEAVLAAWASRELDGDLEAGSPLRLWTSYARASARKVAQQQQLAHQQKILQQQKVREEAEKLKMAAQENSAAWHEANVQLFQAEASKYMLQFQEKLLPLIREAAKSLTLGAKKEESVSQPGFSYIPSLKAKTSGGAGSNACLD